jgi:hypothetical protein
MTDSEERIDDLFEDMAETGLVSTSGRWIERAAVQKNTRLTLELAYSRVLAYDVADRLLMTITDLN